MHHFRHLFPTGDGPPPAVVLTIHDTAFAGPHVVPLFGTALSPPQVSISGLTGGSGVTTLGNTPVGTTATSAITVENIGQSPLIFSSVTTTSEFSQTNNCTTLALQASCTINVSFTPTAAGNATGTLTITDNASNSPQVITLLGGGGDYAVATNQTTASVTPGQSATYALTLTPAGGFNFAVGLSCTGAPQQAACNFPSGTNVTLDGVHASAFNVTVTTTAPSTVTPTRRMMPFRWKLLILLSFVGFLIPVFLRGRRRRRWILLAPLAATLLMAALWSACGGGGSIGGGGGGGNNNPGTPAGTYTLTITAASQGLSHAVSLSLTVN